VLKLRRREKIRQTKRKDRWCQTKSCKPHTLPKEVKVAKMIATLPVNSRPKNRVKL
jgi:hypothetical protein